MTPQAALAEAFRSARSQPVASALAALIVTVVCAVILATTGQRIQDEREVLAGIDDAGTRLILIADTSGSAGIKPAAVERLAALSSTDWVFGLGPSIDAKNPFLKGGGQNVSTRTVYGQLPPQLITNWAMAPGTAAVGPEALQRLALLVPVGAVETNRFDQTIVVAGFRSLPPLQGLETTVLVAPQNPPSHTTAQGPPETLLTIYLMAKHPNQVAGLANTIRYVLGATDNTQVGIDTSNALIAARATVRSNLSRQARQGALLILGVGLVLSGVNVLATVILRQKDFGRRRVLGANRTNIITLVATQTALLATTGAALGILVGNALVARWTGTFLPPAFSAAVAVLTIMAATAAALPPAALAAYRDPIRALRVP